MNEQELIELRKYACSHLGLDENEWLLNKTDYFVMRRRIVYLYLFFKCKKIVDIAKDAGKLPQTVTFAIYTTIENIMWGDNKTYNLTLSVMDRKEIKRVCAMVKEHYEANMQYRPNFPFRQDKWSGILTKVFPF